MRQECLFLFRLQEEYSMESGGEEKFWLESKYTADVLKCFFAGRRVCPGVGLGHVYLYL